jgi:hypothetical protein
MRNFRRHGDDIYLAKRKLKTRLELPKGATYSARRNSKASVLPINWLAIYNIIPMSQSGLNQSRLRCALGIAMVLTISSLTRFKPPAFIMEATRIIEKPIINEITG